MIQITWFEAQGPWIAAMTERDDGDFHYHPGREDDGWRLSRAGGFPVKRLARVHQAHGTAVLCLPEASLWEGVPPEPRQVISPETGVNDGDTRPVADALACAGTDWTLGVSVADCLPVWLGDPGVPCVAVIHAGRRGALAGIAEKTARVLVKRFGADPRRMVAAIGPGAGPCCYEIAPEMASALQAAGHPVTAGRLDLPEVVLRSLVSAGMDPCRIHRTGLCTICSGRFFSYRRGDLSARNLALTSLIRGDATDNHVLQ
ncbi:MAG: laccase domain-containing protein [Candidatus Hydrogenedentes bacterium]|nr:laccase domain-containing protein [Candidatus Hydrogenedentota bacterium]